MIINFGKFKGQEVEEIARTERGASYLRWLIDQPNNNPKFEESNRKRNDYIRQVLSGVKPSNGESEPKPHTEETSALQALTNTVLDLKERVMKLEKYLGSTDGEWS